MPTLAPSFGGQTQNWSQSSLGMCCWEEAGRLAKPSANTTRTIEPNKGKKMDGYNL